MRTKETPSACHTIDLDDAELVLACLEDSNTVEGATITQALCPRHHREGDAGSDSRVPIMKRLAATCRDLGGRASPTRRSSECRTRYLKRA